MIKKNQDYFSICELSTAEASLVSSTAAEFGHQEKYMYVKKLKKLEEALLNAQQHNNQLQLHRAALLQQLQAKKNILEQRKGKQILEGDHSKRGKISKDTANKQDCVPEIIRKASKCSQLYTPSHMKHKYSQKYCTAMPSPKEQSPQRQYQISSNYHSNTKAFPFSLPLRPQQLRSRESYANITFNKTQRRSNFSGKDSSLNFAEKDSIGFASIEDIWNQQKHLNSSKYWKSTAKTIAG